MRLRRMLILTTAVGLIAAIVVPVALALRFTDDSYNMPTGIVGVPYSKQFNGAGGCGPDPAGGNAGLPYQYRILSGGLPPGLSLSKSGLISGTPTVAGDWSFWVELSDEDPPSASWCTPSKAEREFTIHVIAGLTITTPSAPSGTVGTAYSLPLHADGGGTQTWSVTAGSLPPGIGLGSSDGVISGTPTTAGQYTFTVRVADSARSNSKQLTIVVRDPLVVPALSVPGSEVSVPFELKPTVTGGSETKTWTLSGGALPAGLTLDPATGAITGTPTAAGSFPVKLTVTDNEGRTLTVDVALKVAAKLAVTTTRLKAAKLGQLYEASLKTAGGVGPFRWTKVSGRLPKYVHLSPLTGKLVGTPRIAGVFTITFEVRDSLGVKATQKLVLTVVGKKKKAVAGY